MAETRRLFFGAEVVAPWPDQYPKGRVVPEEARHMTLAFLGEVDAQALYGHLKELPQLPLRVGPVGRFDRCQFLPVRTPRVVAWHVVWLVHTELMASVSESLVAWLRSLGYSPRQRDFLPHVTLARRPFTRGAWERAFVPLPMMICGLHLYESCGKLQYESRWSYELMAPCTELDHTADAAFVVRGESLAQLQLHAQVALAMMHPPLVSYFSQLNSAGTWEEMIQELNHLIAIADTEEGCPLKAVSFSGEITEDASGLLTWEMIVDV